MSNFGSRPSGGGRAGRRFSELSIALRTIDEINTGAIRGTIPVNKSNMRRLQTSDEEWSGWKQPVELVRQTV